jgi:hypothetical protein
MNMAERLRLDCTVSLFYCIELKLFKVTVTLPKVGVEATCLGVDLVEAVDRVASMTAMQLATKGYSTSTNDVIRMILDTIENRLSLETKPIDN